MTLLSRLREFFGNDSDDTEMYGCIRCGATFDREYYECPDCGATHAIANTSDEESTGRNA